ncbi:LysR family transcriptional regulator [Vibrio owensii]|uniref:LysR family transcriptional regulator n=1 Tax=Vibrio owensii TaxID=696485 RepID=UPI002FF1F16F
MDRLTAIEVFVCVVEEKTFTSAATKMRMSNSAVTKHIAMLEDGLRVKLLNRTTRRVSLSEAGEVYYGHCKTILSDIAASREAIEFLKDEPHGTIKVNAPVYFGTNFLVPAIAKFQQVKPFVFVELSLTDLYVDLIDTGVDVLFRVGELDDSTFKAKKITSTRTIVCASPSYLSARGVPQTPDELLQHNCLKSTKPKSARGWTFSVAGAHTTLPIGGSFTSNDGEALLNGAKEGIGIARLPSFMIGSHIQQQTLNAILTDYELPPIGIYALYPNSQYMPRKLRAFLDFIQTYFESDELWEH